MAVCWRGAFALVYCGRVEPERFTLEFAEDCLAGCEAYWRGVKPFLNAFRINYYLVESDADADRISLAFNESRKTRRPVAVLVGDEYQFNG